MCAELNDLYLPVEVNSPLFNVDALVAMEKAMKRDNITVNDRQLACARIGSTEGQDYLKGMAAAGNYAWVNRSSMTFLTRQVKSILSSSINQTEKVKYDPSFNTISYFVQLLLNR